MERGEAWKPVEVPILGKPLPIARGWTSVDARILGGQNFRFVNTHLEAFHDFNQVPSIRAQQASELVAPGGPATTSSTRPALIGSSRRRGDVPRPGGSGQGARRGW